MPGGVLLLDLAREHQDGECLNRAHNQQDRVRHVDLHKALPRPEQHRHGSDRKAAERGRDGTFDARMPMRPITTKHRPDTPETPMYRDAASVPEIAVPPNRPAPATARPNVNMARPVIADTMAIIFNIFLELLIASPLLRRGGRFPRPPRCISVAIYPVYTSKREFTGGTGGAWGTGAASTA